MPVKTCTTLMMLPADAGDDFDPFAQDGAEEFLERSFSRATQGAPRVSERRFVGIESGFFDLGDEYADKRFAKFEADYDMPDEVQRDA